MKTIIWIGLFCPPIWFAFAAGAVILHDPNVWAVFIITAIPVFFIALFVNLNCLGDIETRDLNPIQTWKFYKAKNFK